MTRPVDAHNVKLFIINHPTIRNQQFIAKGCGVSQWLVSKVMAELNISPTGKPLDCVG